MNEVLKQRLVGALILLALAVVFWPIIFVEPETQQQRDELRIPPKPQVDSREVPPPDTAGLRRSPEFAAGREAEEEQREALAYAERAAADAAARREAAVAEAPESDNSPAESPPTAVEPAQAVTATPAPATEAPVKPGIDSDGVPIAWILQVASVSSEEKAEALQAQLLALGHKAYVKKVRRFDKVLLRVYIGPKFERKQLEALQATVDEEFKVKSMVTRYIP